MELEVNVASWPSLTAATVDISSAATGDSRLFGLVQQVKKNKEDGKKKAKKFQLGVAESKMGNSIQEESGIPCVCNDFTGEILRGIRMHATRFMKDLEESDMNKVRNTSAFQELQTVPVCAFTSVVTRGHVTPRMQNCMALFFLCMTYIVVPMLGVSHDVGFVLASSVPSTDKFVCDSCLVAINIQRTCWAAFV